MHSFKISELGLALMVTVLSSAPAVTGCDAYPDTPFEEDLEGDADVPANAEACDNGLDDDGDGFVDEECTCERGEVQVCYGGAASRAGLGACLLGQQVCGGVGEFSVWGVCTGWVAPSVEICGDGIDQDCDGLDSSCTSTCGDAICEGLETCETCPEDCGACPVDPAPCGDSPSGTAESRTMYESPTVPHGEECRSEMQTRTCVDGEWTAWSGSYTFPGCVVDEAPDCINDGVSPQLEALHGGPYQNCGGVFEAHTSIALDTAFWSGCCGYLVRVCAVEGYSTLNRLYCDADADVWCNPDESGECQF